MRANLNSWRESASLIIAAKTLFNSSAACNFKLLCLKRSSKSGVMPNHYVFPGGNVADTDGSDKWLKIYQKNGHDLNSFSRLYPKANVPEILQDKKGGGLPKFLSLRICAIRETFEECGVLICKSRKNCGDTHWTSYVDVKPQDILQWQDKVLNNPNEFINLCSEFEIYPDVWALQLWNNWMTPPSVKSKFDTIFFISTFNKVPETYPELKEIQDIKWATPDEYIKENNKKNIMFAIPQFYEISRLRNFIDINTLSKYVDERSQFGCEMYLPHRILTGSDGIYSIFPGDDLYPKTIDRSKTEVTFVDKLPDSYVKNRLCHKKHVLNHLIIENLIPKADHLSPVVDNEFETNITVKP